MTFIDPDVPHEVQVRSLKIVLSIMIPLIAIISYGLFLAYKHDLRQQEVVWQGDCPVVGVAPPSGAWGYGSSGGLVADCNGKRYNVMRQSVLINYILSHGPLTCSLTRGGWLMC